MLSLTEHFFASLNFRRICKKRLTRVVVAAGLIVVATSILGGTESVAATTQAATPEQPASRNPYVQRLLNEAQNDLASGELKKAQIKLKLAASIEPNNPMVLARLGLSQFQQGNIADAEATLRRARQLGAPNELVLAPMFEAMLTLGEYQTVLDLYPDPGPNNRSTAAAITLRARAAAMQTLGDSQGASTAMTRSLAIRRDFDGLMTAAQIALSQQDFSRADGLVDEALKLDPGNTDALVFKLSLALDAGEQSRALEIAEKLVADKPRSLAARLARIKVYLAVGKTDAARPEVDRILSEAPGTPIAMYYRAIILARHGNIPAAWAAVHSLPPEIIQSDPEMATNIANMAAGARFLETAANILNVAVARNPQLLDARLQLAELRLRQKSPEYALNVLAMVQDSKDPKVAVLLAKANLMMGRGAKAQQEITRAIELRGGEALAPLGKDLALKSLSNWLAHHPDDLLVRRQYAVLLLRFGDIANARKKYEELVHDHGDDALALNNLSWLVVNEDPARSLKLAQQAVQHAPNSPDYLDTLGCMQLRQSDSKGALASLQRAHNLRPQDSEISYHLALALQATGAHGAAKSVLSAAVAQGGFADLEKARQLLSTWR